MTHSLIQSQAFTHDVQGLGSCLVTHTAQILTDDTQGEERHARQEESDDQRCCLAVEGGSPHERAGVDDYQSSWPTQGFTTSRLARDSLDYVWAHLVSRCLSGKTVL